MLFGKQLRSVSTLWGATQPSWFFWGLFLAGAAGNEPRSQRELQEFHRAQTIKDERGASGTGSQMRSPQEVQKDVAALDSSCCRRTVVFALS